MKLAVMLTSTIRCTSLTVPSRSEIIGKSAALLTSMSTGPSSFSIWALSFSAAAKSAMSNWGKKKKTKFQIPKISFLNRPYLLVLFRL